MPIRHVSAGGAPLARVIQGEGGPVFAVMLHDGHEIRPSLQHRLGLSEQERLREEDPFTASMCPEGLPRIEVLRSRFEVDLNRPRFRAVYQGPQDAWGLHVWEGELPDAEDRISRAVYDAFYALAFDELSRIAEEHERFVVLDLHSYNHRRDGAALPLADPECNPDINLGTGRISRPDHWRSVIDAFSESLLGSGFDVRENVKFRGGHFAHWVDDTFPERGCVLALEFKKTYMDEWTGVADRSAIDARRVAVEHAVKAMRPALAGGR